MSEPPGADADPDRDADARPEPRAPTASASSASSLTGQRSSLPSLGPRGEGWLLLQVTFMVAVIAAGLAVGADWTGAPRFAAAVAGGALILAGVALGYLGIRDLDRSMSPLPRPRDTAVLIQDGVYKRLRHPIYAALIMISLGWGLLTASLLALGLAVALAVLLDLKARREEVWLRARYPGYVEYAGRTRRFVPGLY